MECPKCKAENPEAKKFCRKCGAKLSLVCPQCGSEILSEDDFCGDCGHRLKDSNLKVPIDFNQPQSYTPKFIADKILNTRSSIEGERKLVTVLFADVANYRSISGVSFQGGMVLAEIGRVEDGIVILKDAIDLCEKFGAHAMLGQMYNSLGYCYSEVYQIDQAWKYNLKSEEIARGLFLKYPMGRGQSGHVLAQAEINLVENLFDEGNIDKAWEKIESIKKDFSGKDFFYSRYQWESRMNYLAAQILIKRNDLNQAESIIDSDLKMARKELMLKRAGSFLRLLGEVQMRRNENENALKSFNESINILKKVENPRQLWQAYGSLASAYDKMGRRSEAQEQWDAASTIIQNVAKGLSDSKLREGFLNAQQVRDILSKAVS